MLRQALKAQDMPHSTTTGVGLSVMALKAHLTLASPFTMAIKALMFRHPTLDVVIVRLGRIK